MRTATVRLGPLRTPGPADEAAAGVAMLFGSHRLAMVRLALLLVDDIETAEDVVQDAFAALYRRWAALQNADAAVAYLRVSVVNGSRSVLRRRLTVRRYLAYDDAALSVEPADESSLLADEHRAVLAAIRALPRRQREIIVLRYWSELSELETSAALGISVGAVKSTASRARESVARFLGGTR